MSFILYSLFSYSVMVIFCCNQISTVPYLYCKQTNTSVWRGNKDLVSLLQGLTLPTYLHNIPAWKDREGSDLHSTVGSTHVQVLYFFSASRYSLVLFISLTFTKLAWMVWLFAASSTRTTVRRDVTKTRNGEQENEKWEQNLT